MTVLSQFEHILRMPITILSRNIHTTYLPIEFLLRIKHSSYRIIQTFPHVDSSQVSPTLFETIDLREDKQNVAV